MNVHGTDGGPAGHGDGRRPTIRDVARSAGVSAQTVSRVINGSPQVRPATRDRVVASVAALGFQPDEAARALARLKHRTPEQEPGRTP